MSSPWFSVTDSWEAQLWGSHRNPLTWRTPQNRKLVRPGTAHPVPGHQRQVTTGFCTTLVCFSLVPFKYKTFLLDLKPPHP